MGYEKGTQEQLDAAREDARMLPYNTVFLTKVSDNSPLPDGEAVVRAGGTYDDEFSVRFKSIDDRDCWYCDAADLEPIK